MAEPNGPTVKLWSLVLSQVPWFLTILALGSWSASKFDMRLVSLERAVTRIEGKIDRDAAEKLEALKQEIERMRKAGR